MFYTELSFKHRNYHFDIIFPCFWLWRFVGMAVRGLRWFVSTSKPYYIKGLLSVRWRSTHTCICWNLSVMWGHVSGRTASPLCSRTSCLIFHFRIFFFGSKIFFFEKKYIFFFFEKKIFFQKFFFGRKKYFFELFFQTLFCQTFFFQTSFELFLKLFSNFFFNFFSTFFSTFFFQTFLFQTFLSTSLVFTTEHKVCDIVIFCATYLIFGKKTTKFHILSVRNNQFFFKSGYTDAFNMWLYVRCCTIASR